MNFIIHYRTFLSILFEPLLLQRLRLLLICAAAYLCKNVYKSQFNWKCFPLRHYFD